MNETKSGERMKKSPEICLIISNGHRVGLFDFQKDKRERILQDIQLKM